MPPTPSRKTDSRFVALFLIDPHLCGVLATREAFVRGCFNNSPLGFLTGSVRVELRYEKRRDLLAVLLVAFFFFLRFISCVHLLKSQWKAFVRRRRHVERGHWIIFLLLSVFFIFYFTASSTKQQQPVWLPFSCVL